MQIWAEPGKSALPICNYSQILYQFLTFTQNLKRSLGMSWIARWKCHDTDRLLALEIFLQYHLYAVVFAHGSCRI